MWEGWALCISFLYVLAVLAAAKQAEQRKLASSFVLRKLAHLLVGSWVLPAYFLFEHWWMAVIPPFCFVWANLYLEKRRFFSFEEGEGYGTVYFPISIVFLFTLFWEMPLRPYACSGILAMAWGDPLAAIVGTKWGRLRFPFAAGRKTVEGSLVMLGGSFLAGWVSLALFQGGSLEEIWMPSFSLAAVATLMELFAGRGLDNLTVPLATALSGYLFFVRG